jgi:lactoylglutathione lyase
VEIKDKGAKVIRDPGPMMGSKLLLAFIEDPNGYKIELIEKGTF